MVNVHGQRHDEFAVLLLIFAPSDHRRKEFPLIKHMYIKMGIFYPWQTGYIKEICWLIC